MSLLDRSRDRCKCGHMQKNHRGIRGLIGGGLSLYKNCRHCDCKLFDINEVFMGEKEGQLIYEVYPVQSSLLKEE